MSTRSCRSSRSGHSACAGRAGRSGRWFAAGRTLLICAVLAALTTSADLPLGELLLGRCEAAPAAHGDRVAARAQRSRPRKKRRTTPARPDATEPAPAEPDPKPEAKPDADAPADAAAPGSPAPAPASTAPATPAPTVSESTTPEVASSAELVDVDALRQEYLKLRDELFRSRARASTISSQLYSTKVTIRFAFTSGRYYGVNKATIRLDGASVFDDTDGAIANDDAVRFEGYVAPGKHLVTFRIEATGKDDDRFTSAHEAQIALQAVAGKDLVVAAKAKDGGDIAYAWKRGEKGSYGLGIDVAVKTQKREAAKGKSSALPAPRSNLALTAPAAPGSGAVVGAPPGGAR